ncbi:MAG: carboxypeptidase regulatory-like domain-containing protein [Planctomycetota bacterium]|jgi:protocatechuate 3,4-dioxygenase beta subunit
MRGRSGILLALVAVAAVTATAALFLSDGAGSSSTGLDRTEEGGNAEDLREPGRARLVGDEAARARAEEAREAEEAAERAAAAFPRSQGVFGRVLDARGTPIPGATVKLAVDYARPWNYGRPDPPAMATSMTDEDGHYLVGPAPEGRLRVRAEAFGYAPAIQLVRRRGYRVDLVLDRGATLEVAVQDREGAPVLGARLLHQSGTVVTEGVSGADGAFLFGSVPTGSGTLTVTAGGYAAVRQEVLLAPEVRERSTVILPPPTVMEGRALADEDGRPLADVTITVSYVNAQWLDPTGPATTDPEGRFRLEITAAEGQPIEVQAGAEGFAPHRTSLQVSDSGSGTMLVELRLMRAGAALEGQVVDGQGKPVPDVRVTYIDNRRPTEQPEAVTDAEGRFVLRRTVGATPGSRVSLIAVSEHLGVGVAWLRIPPEDQVVPPVVIELPGVGSLSGRVRDAAGEPVAGALVSLTPDWRNVNRRTPVGDATPPWLLAQALQNPAYARLDAVSDADGSYLIESIPELTYLVSVVYGLDALSLPDPVKVLAGGREELDVTLGEGATIEGRVVDASGVPVAGASVTARARSSRGQPPGSWISARSQTDGTFVLRGVAAESYRIRANAAGFRSDSARDVPPGTTDLVLTLRPLGRIEGVVRHDGRPYRGAFDVLVVRRPAEGELTREFLQSQRPTHSFNTDDGEYVVRGLAAGVYDVSASTPEGLVTLQPLPVDVADGRVARADPVLSSGSVLTGIVVEDATGAPVAQAQINVQPRPGEAGTGSEGRARTDAEGRFSVRGLAPGNYLAYVTPPQGVGFHLPLEIHASETKELRLVVRAPGSIRFLVTDAEGAPLGGATTQVTSEAGVVLWPDWNRIRREGVQFGPDTWRRYLETDAQGVLERTSVPPGRYRVGAHLDGYVPGEALWIEVASDRTTEARLTLEPAAAGGPEAGPGR